VNHTFTHQVVRHPRPSLIGVAAILLGLLVVASCNAQVIRSTYGPQADRVAQSHTTVHLYFIWLNDNGKHGPKTGCGDSAYRVDRQVPATKTPLRAAMRLLLSMHRQTVYGPHGRRLENVLYQSHLKIESINLVNGKATIRLKGRTALNGECDDPRAVAQLRQTAFQRPTVKKVAIYINGEPLWKHFSLK